MVSQRLGAETVHPFYAVIAASLVLASIILCPEGSIPNLAEDPSVDLYLPADAQVHILSLIVRLARAPHA